MNFMPLAVQTSIQLDVAMFPPILSLAAEANEPARTIKQMIQERVKRMRLPRCMNSF